MRYLGWVAAAIIGFIGNEAVAQFRIRVGTQIGSAALVADGQHARMDGFTSLAVLLGGAGIWLGFPILDPLLGIAITVAILFVVKDAARAIWRRLIDGIEPEIVTRLERMPLDVSGVRGVHRVRALGRPHDRDRSAPRGRSRTAGAGVRWWNASAPPARRRAPTGPGR